MKLLKEYTTGELEAEISRRNKEVNIIVIPIGVDVTFTYGIDVNENVDSIRKLNYNSCNENYDAHKLGIKVLTGKVGNLLK